MKYANNFTKIFTFVVIFLLFGNFHYVNVRFCFVSSTAVALSFFYPVLVSGTTIIISYLLALFSLFCFFVLRLFFRNFISVIYPIDSFLGILK